MECNIVTGSHFFIILFLIAVSLCTSRHSNEENYFYSTFDRITSGEIPIKVMAEILWHLYNPWRSKVYQYKGVVVV